MSILDGLVSSERDLRQRVAASGLAAQRTLSLLNLNEGSKQVLELMGKGLSLADIFEFTPEHRNAIFASGCKLFQSGEREKARGVLTQLALLEPMDPRPLYVLGAISQAEQDFAAAAQFYVNFLALDATNVSGYLRLAECLFGAREYKEARGVLQTALEFCKTGGGKPEEREHAQKILALIDEIEAADKTRA